MNTEATRYPLSGTLPKPAKGTATRERRRRAGHVRYIERLRKAEAKVRDGHRCRFPGCPVRGVGRVESMHADDKGMGGDHGARSSMRADFLTGCYDHHQGRRSVHSGHLEFRATSEAGCDGPVAWYGRLTLDQPFDDFLGTTKPMYPVPGAPR